MNTRSSAENYRTSQRGNDEKTARNQLAVSHLGALVLLRETESLFG